MNQLLRIGQVAKEVGLNPKTIRYYEEIGLLPKPKRSETIQGKGYRLYTQEDVNHLTFIKRAKFLDLSLAQIKDLLASVEEGCCGSARPHLASLFEQKRQEIEERIRDLNQLRQYLTQFKQKMTHDLQASKVISSCTSTAGPSDCVFAESPIKAAACCPPFCPDACDLLPEMERSVHLKEGKSGLNKVVLLTKEGAKQLFQREDNEIYAREDLIEVQDGWVKVTGRCSGQSWYVKGDEILKIERG